MNPTVSILVPSYNHARFLARCIDSAIAQTFEDWEMVVVDDCSADESAQTLHEIADSRVRVFNNEANLGTYGTLSRGLSEAKGRFIAILNSDDLWAPDKLQRQLELLSSTPNAAFAYTLGSIIDENGEPVTAPGVQARGIHLDWPTTSEQEVLPRLLEENRILASSVMFRREFVSFHADLRYSGDWVALLEASLRGVAACDSEALTFWRIHASNSYRRSPNQVAEEILIRRSILESGHLWKVREIRTDEIERSLGMCARHLSALYVLTGQMNKARETARISAGLSPGPSASRRRLIASLPNSIASRLLRLGHVDAASGILPDTLKFNLP